MSGKAIVLDANILIRAVLGKRARELIFNNVATVKFFAPDVAYADARKYLPALLKKRGVDPDVAMLVRDRLESVVQFELRTRTTLALAWLLGLLTVLHCIWPKPKIHTMTEWLFQSKLSFERQFRTRKTANLSRFLLAATNSNY